MHRQPPTNRQKDGERLEKRITQRLGASTANRDSSIGLLFSCWRRLGQRIRRNKPVLHGFFTLFAITATTQDTIDTIVRNAPAPT